MSDYVPELRAKEIRAIAVLAWSLNHFGRGKDSETFLNGAKNVARFIETGKTVRDQ